MNTPLNLGVVIGRFQVDKLTVGHLHLLNSANSQSDQLLVILGSPASRPTNLNPLDFATRQAMILEKFPNASVVELIDSPTNEGWSINLDRLIRGKFPESNATLFGSRDSFLASYSGIFQTKYLEPICECSGTERRDRLAKNRNNGVGYRRGVIRNTLNRPPIIYQTVDVAIFNEDATEVLLANKKAEGERWRFVGGFLDPADPSLEYAAKREALEETSFSLELDALHYIGSTKIDDWRYRGTKDSILTAFYRTKRIFGPLKAGDDIDKLDWFPIGPELLTILVEAHAPLGKMLLDHLNQ